MANKTNLKTLLVISVLLVAMACGIAAGEVIYVDDDASLGGNGQTWGTAYKYLQDALLANAISGDMVWVAAGVYKPDQDEGGNVTPGDREGTFQLINGVAIYGAFPSGGGTWSERDPNDPNKETILSGDLAGNDVPVSDPCDLLDEPTRAENSYHILSSNGTNVATVLDGFTITAGNANGDWQERQDTGGGMFNDEGSNPTVTNCTFTVNSALGGGGMFNWNESSPTVTNCTFSGNWAAEWCGGGMNNYGESNPTLTDCTFSGNSAGSWGGGMSNDRGSSPTLTNCTFSGNSADDKGGGMDNNWSSPTLSHCTFSGNSAKYGGGMHNAVFSSPTLTDCTFSGNSAEDGGGMYNSNDGSPTVTDCTFSGNSAESDGGGMYNYEESYPTLTNCTFSDNSAGEGGGMYNYGASTRGSTTLTNCTFSGNSAASDGGGMYNSNDSNPTLTDCTFRESSADSGGGMYNDNSSPTLTNCTFSGNSAAYHGGGMYNDANGSPTLTNCTFSGNSAAYRGGGMMNWDGSPTLTNCIFSGNSASLGGGMYNYESSSPTLTNCTFSGNSVNYGGGEATPPKIRWVWPFVTTYQYSGASLEGFVTVPDFVNEGGPGTIELSVTIGSPYNIFETKSFYVEGGRHYQLLIEGAFYGVWSDDWVMNVEFIIDSPAAVYPLQRSFSGPLCDSASITNIELLEPGDSADDGGGMMNWDGSSPTLTNCILWADTGSQIFSSEASLATVGYCNVQGGYSGTGNINADPLFVDADGPDDTVGTADDNLRLSAGSPCIDAADNTAVPSGVTTDLDGKPRFVDDLCTTDTGNGTPPIVDMGAYEFLRSDIDSNGSVDMVDFSRFALYWKESGCGACGGADLTCDGDVDLYDLKEFGDNWLAGVQ